MGGAKASSWLRLGSEWVRSALGVVRIGMGCMNLNVRPLPFRKLTCMFRSVLAPLSVVVSWTPHRTGHASRHDHKMGQSVGIPEGKLDIIIEGIESDLKSLATRLHEHIIVFCIVLPSKD